MSFFKKTNWFGVAMVEMGIILFFLITTFVPPMTSLDVTQLRMKLLEFRISYFSEKHGKVPESLEVIKEASRNHSLFLDGWGLPIQYTVTNNVVSLTCHIKGNENEILIRRFSIEKAIVKGEGRQ